jgi:type II secretory pathway predicted ATPase ExeA
MQVDSRPNTNLQRNLAHRASCFHVSIFIGFCRYSESRSNARNHRLLSATMYLQYFQLEEMPFNVTPDPRFLYYAPHHQEAYDHLMYGHKQVTTTCVKKAIRQLEG